MNPSCIVINQIPDLLSGPVHSDPFHILITTCPFNSFQEPGRYMGPGGKLSHTDHPFFSSYRHNPGYDRDINSGQFAAFAEIIEVTIVKKELTYNIVSTGINLCFQVVDLFE